MPRPRLHDDALRARLLEVASVVISTDGPSALTVRDVARRAGTSGSAVYALFGSRDALVGAVRDEAAERFTQHLMAPPLTGDPAADLLALGLAYRRSALDDPHFYRVMFDRPPAPGAGDPPVTDVGSFRLLQDAVARVLTDAGLPFERAGAAALEPALGLWALVHGLVSLELSGLLPGSPGERAARYTAALRAGGPTLVNGLRPPRPPG